jgi:hypothetical protein
MADISMCRDHFCVLKESCYRYTATPSTYQSYFTTSPRVNGLDCNYYWKTKTKNDDENKHSDAEESA